jgi:AraC-like DNA-binding protein
MDSRVTVEFRVPSSGLATYFSTFYEMHITGDQPVLDCLPPEWANIQTGIDNFFSLGPDPGSGLVPSPSQTVLRGPTKGPTWVSGLGRVFGLGILPTGWSRLWTHPCQPYADRIVCLSEMVGVAAYQKFESDLRNAANFDERISLAESWLTGRLALTRPDRNQHLIDRLFAMLNDPEILEIDQLADSLGLSPSQFARMCKRAFGYPPKLLLRRQRWMRMLGEMHSRPYSEWRDFIDPHYVDQSHMLRDFREFLGMSPSAYFALSRPILNATTRARAAAAGKPYQILHDPEAAKTGD